jgi:hypothetical protein
MEDQWTAASRGNAKESNEFTQWYLENLKKDPPIISKKMP